MTAPTPVLVPMGGTVPDGVNAYVYACDMPSPSSGDVVRRWTYRNMVRSVQMRSGAIVKIREPFDKHNDDAALSALVTESVNGGVPHPSSYASLFHRHFFAPKTRKSFQHLFAGEIVGGWHQQIIGDSQVVDRALWKYDINSAYLWSAMEGLPHPETMAIVKRYSGPGVYWVQSPGRRDLPHPWHRIGMAHPATSDEIELFGLRSFVFGHGIAFQPNTFDVSPIRDAVMRWSASKAVARAFWGRWASSAGPRQQTFDRHGQVRSDRTLPTLWRLPVWAALITSRLRLRLWRESLNGGCHLVLTDALVSSRELRTSADLGGWREVAYYSHGGIIRPQGVEPFTPYH